MRRAILEDAIEELWGEDYTTKVQIEQLATGDTNHPAYDDAHPIATGVLMLIQQMGARERQQRELSYTQPPTHTAYCDAADYLQVGYRLRETHTIDAAGKWRKLLATDDIATYQVLGIERIPRTRLAGLTPPDQRVLILSQVSPMT